MAFQRAIVSADIRKAKSGGSQVYKIFATLVQEIIEETNNTEEWILEVRCKGMRTVAGGLRPGPT